MEFVSQAQAAMGLGDVAVAEKWMSAALAAAPRDPEVLAAFGEMLAEVGNTEKAILSLRKAISIRPESGHEKYLCLAQLLTDNEQAVQAYEAGIGLLKAELMDSESMDAMNEGLEEASDVMDSDEGDKDRDCNDEGNDSSDCGDDDAGGTGLQTNSSIDGHPGVPGKAGTSRGGPGAEPGSNGAVDKCLNGSAVCQPLDDSVSVTHLHSSLAAALCALVERLMDAATELEDTAARCRELLEEAAAVDPRSPEPAQVQASLEHELGHSEAALKHLQHSLALWWRSRRPQAQLGSGPEGVAAGVVPGRAQDAETSGKELGEVLDSGRCRQDVPAGAAADLPSVEFRIECCKLLLQVDTSTNTAVEILESLLEETDSDPHLWHLLALAHYAGGELELAGEALGRGLLVLQQSPTTPANDTLILYKDLQLCVLDAFKKLDQESPGHGS